MRTMQFQIHANEHVDDHSSHDRAVRCSIVSSLLVAVALFAAILSASYSSPSSKNHHIISRPAPVYNSVTVVSSSKGSKLQDDDEDQKNTMKSTIRFWPLVVSDDSPSSIEEIESISIVRSTSNDSSTRTAVIVRNAVNEVDHYIDEDDDQDDTTMALDISRNEIVGHVFIPALLEVGTIVLFQSIGLPLLSRGLSLLRKGRWIRLRGVARFFNARFGKVMSRLVHFCKLGYKKTNASKIVTRTKKLIKHLMHQHHHHSHDDDEHNDHEHDDEHMERATAEKVAA